jgi:hypothetical protein
MRHALSRPCICWLSHTIGYIETAADGKQTGKDERFRTIGYYDPRADVTRDDRFRTVGHGNLLASLITCR